jgi:DNA-binding HxlR family transcriptional regulator
MACSVGRSLSVIGDHWTPLIVRDLFVGIRRFDDLRRDLEISRKLLSERLGVLQEHGVVERVPYQHNPPRYEYVLTEKGRDLAPVLLAIKAWGDRWMASEAGPPVLFRHRGCGQIVDAVPSCSHCGEQLTVGDFVVLAGPGAAAGPGTWGVPDALARIAGAGSSGPRA